MLQFWDKVTQAVTRKGRTLSQYCFRFGRKPTIISNIVLASIACIGVAIIPINTGKLGKSIPFFFQNMIGQDWFVTKTTADLWIILYA